MDQKALLLVGGAPTNVFSLLSSATRGNSEVPLILLIPGNPGISHLYIPFAIKVFQLGKNKFDVSVVSNAGQSPGCYKEKPIQLPGCINCTDHSKDLNSSTDWFSLEDQVDHKLAYIEQEAAERKSLILIGHSIGCLVVLKMLQHLNPVRVKKVILLFPVIERVSLSPRALSWQSYLWSFLQGPFLFVVGMIFKLTPSFMWTYFWKYYFCATPLGHLDHLTEGMMVLNEKCMYNLLQYARYEMKRINDPPLDLIGKNIHKTVFYYGVKDHWNVDSCYKDMVARYPGKVHLLPSHVPHSFVVHASDEVADIVHPNFM